LGICLIAKQAQTLLARESLSHVIVAGLSQQCLSLLEKHLHDMHAVMVARAGIEPATRGFSITAAFLKSLMFNGINLNMFTIIRIFWSFDCDSAVISLPR